MRSTLFVFANGFAADEAVLTDGAEGERHASASQAVAFSPAAIATGEYPNVARFAEMGVEPSNDDSFERGLRGVLDGIATDIQACTTKPVKALTKPKGSRSRANKRIEPPPPLSSLRKTSTGHDLNSLIPADSTPSLGHRS
jgi:hypothetical protein